MYNLSLAFLVQFSIRSKSLYNVITLYSIDKHKLKISKNEIFIEKKPKDRKRKRMHWCFLKQSLKEIGCHFLLSMLSKNNENGKWKDIERKPIWAVSTCHIR